MPRTCLLDLFGHVLHLDTLGNNVVCASVVSRGQLFAQC